MRVAVDLHIHSALSPCSDNEMTPNNIVHMAKLKGLTMIAVTDHNSAENLQAISCCAREQGIILVPGLEVETKEEVHVICLFKTLEKAIKMQEKVYAALPDIQNREDIFGQQLIMNEEDVVSGTIRRMLITATGLSLDEVFQLVKSLEGVAIPAHVDRESYSILSNLGLIPEHLDIRYLEVSKGCNLEEFKKKNPRLEKYHLIKSSDAHRLGDIMERESFIELDGLSVENLIEALKGKSLNKQ